MRSGYLTPTSPNEGSIASASGGGFSPLFGFGVDFVLVGGDFGIRLEYEHLNEIGNGLFDNTVTGASEGFVSEGYSYDQLSVGFVVAF